MAEPPVRLLDIAEIEQHVLLVQLAAIAESIPVSRADVSMTLSYRPSCASRR